MTRYFEEGLYVGALWEYETEVAACYSNETIRVLKLVRPVLSLTFCNMI